MQWYKYYKDTKGSVGVLAVIVMMLVAALGAGVYALSTTEVSIAHSMQDGTAAQYMAENGAQRVTAELRNSGSLLDEIKNLTVGGKTTKTSSSKAVSVGIEGKYEVTIVRLDTSIYIVTSLGMVNNAKRQVTFTVTLPTGNPLFDYVSYSYSNSTINSSSNITGNVGSRGDVTQNSGTVNGNIEYNGKYIHWNGTLTGTANKRVNNNAAIPATLPDFVSFDSSKYSSGIALPGSIYNGGNITLSNSVYYVDGDFGIGSSTTLNVPSGRSATIYAKGSIYLNWGSKINGNITLIAGNGNIELNGGSILAPNGTVNIYANGYFHNNSNSSITSSYVTVEAVSDIQLNGSPITVDDQGTIKMYTKGSFAFNSNSEINGACFVIAGGDIGVNGGVGKETILISNGNSQVNSNSSIAQIYAVGTLEFDGGTLNYNKQLAQQLNLSDGSKTLIFGIWKNHK